MGTEDSKEKLNHTNQAEYFYDKDLLKEKVKIEIAIKNIESGNCIVQFIPYSNPERTDVITEANGITEEGQLDYSSGKITFLKFFVLDYYFGTEQPIDFFISGSINAKISTTLSCIMGSRGQTLCKSIEGFGEAILEIRGISSSNKHKSDFIFNISLEGNFQDMGIIYNIYYLGGVDKNKPSLLYKSELISRDSSESNFDFNQSSIPDIFLTPEADHNKSHIQIEIYDKNNQKLLGIYKGLINKLIGIKTNINLGMDKRAIINVNLVKNYSFIDYLRGGMKINLAVVIDFSSSNGLQTSSQSLHFLSPKPNQYEMAIKCCGNVVAYYDYDQLFPTYGFGGKFFGSSSVDHCFPLNRNIDEPELQGIEAILQTYRQVLGETELSGPSYLHYIIDLLNKRVKSEVEEETDYARNYYIIMVLTNGLIEDINQTIDSLVEASYLPISIIIIGIGNADFSNMNVLDADEEVLMDSKGRKADRDLVQFVPFNQFKGDGDKLAGEVLEEVPRQIIEYYQHKKIPPGEAIYQISDL